MGRNGIKRLVWADALRGLLILLVVLGHCLQYGDYENRMSWNIIYSFHMPAFFVISGYVSYKNDYKFLSLKGKFQQLMLPFFSWTILNIILYGGGLEEFINILLCPDISYWFIYVLFFIILLFIVIRNFSSSYMDKNGGKSIDKGDVLLFFVIVGLVLLMVLTEFRLFGFQFFAYYFGFYVLGYWLKKFNLQFNYLMIAILGVVWFVLSIFWRMHNVPIPFSSITFLPASLLIYIYRYITAFVGSLFFISFAMKFMNQENLVIRILSYLGKISLGIYIIHSFTGRYIVEVLDLFFQKNSLIYIIFKMISFVLVSVTLTNVIQRLPYIRFFFLGKK